MTFFTRHNDVWCFGGSSSSPLESRESTHLTSILSLLTSLLLSKVRYLLYIDLFHNDSKVFLSFPFGVSWRQSLYSLWGIWLGVKDSCNSRHPAPFVQLSTLRRKAPHWRRWICCVIEKILSFKNDDDDDYWTTIIGEHIAIECIW